MGLSEDETGRGDTESWDTVQGWDLSLAAKGHKVKSCLRELCDTSLKKREEDLVNLSVCLKHKGLNKNRRRGKRQKEKEMGQSGFMEEGENSVLWLSGWIRNSRYLRASLSVRHTENTSNIKTLTNNYGPWQQLTDLITFTRLSLRHFNWRSCRETVLKILMWVAF